MILSPGDYGPLTAALESTQMNLNVHGADGQPRPRIITNALFGLDLGGSGSTARHLEIHQSANGTYQSALVLESGQGSDLVLSNAGGGSAAACTLLGTSQLTNSVCEATGPNAYGVFPYRRSVGPKANSSIVRNATVVASAATGTGVYAIDGAGPGEAANLTVTNTVIVVGQGAAAVAAYKQADGASITIDHSNFGLESAQTGAQIIKGAGNQQLGAAPSFVAPGDYHQAPGSITIDAGATNSLNGLTDFDGDPRSLGLGTDIGADEFVPAPTVLTGDANTIGATSAIVGGQVNANTVATTFHFDVGPTTAYGTSTPDRGAGAGSTPGAVSEALAGLSPSTTYHYRLVATSAGGTAMGDDRTFTTLDSSGGADVIAPAISGLSLKPRAFRAGRGTRITVTVSEGGTLRFTVQRRLAGRKARYRTRGSFTKTSKAGKNRLRFSGRLKGRKLAAGRYRLRVVAVDAAGNRSTAKLITFRIVRR